MTYTVKEIYFTLQGEGANTGRPAVFLRFAGCNLWSGHERDRADAVCRFCDTEFVGTDGPGGGRFASAAALASAVRMKWPEEGTGYDAFVVCTGGEPLLQLDRDLIDALHQQGLEIALETNGTLPVPEGVDWICVSPKAGAGLVVASGDEIKLVYPQDGAEPPEFEVGSTSGISSCSPWMVRSESGTPTLPRATVPSTPVGSSAFRHTSCWAYREYLPWRGTRWVGRGR